MDAATHTHPCPVDACGKEVPLGRLMCSRHWHMLTSRQRAAVIREWNGGRPLKGYRLTRAAAVAKVNALQAQS